MRFVLVALGALAFVGLAASPEPASAAKTKMGCERGKEAWNATLGRCEASKGGKATRTARRSAKKAAPKTAAKKKQ